MRKTRRWQEDVELDRRMHSAGVPLEVEEEDDSGSAVPPSNGLLIEQNGECLAQQVGSYCTVYVLDVSIVPNFPWSFEITSVALDLPWQDLYFQWIRDPLETDTKFGLYWVPTQDSLWY